MLKQAKHQKKGFSPSIKPVAIVNIMSKNFNSMNETIDISNSNRINKKKGQMSIILPVPCSKTQQQQKI